MAAKWKRHGSLEGVSALFAEIRLPYTSDASCPHCCLAGESPVDIDYAGSVRENNGAQDVYTFTAKSRCTSSRAHLGCSLVLVVSDIPGLVPILSVPVTLQARFRRYRSSHAVEPAKLKAKSLEEKTSSLVKQLSVNQLAEISSAYHKRRPEIGAGPFLLQKAVDSLIAHSATRLPASTVATSSLILSLFTGLTPSHVSSIHSPFFKF